MKRFFLVLVVLCLCGFAEAQKVTVQKNTFVPTASGVYEVSQVSATNTKTGFTLVVWEKSASSNTDHSIVARLINPAGKPVTPQFTLINGPRGAHPSVAYNPARNEFVLVYDDNPLLSLVHTDVYVQRLTPNGRLSGTPLKVTTDTTSTAMANILARVVYNPVTTGYTLLWIREAVNSTQVSEGNNGLAGLLLTPTATISGTPKIVRKTTVDGSNLWEPVVLDLQNHPTNGKLMLTFAQVISGTRGTQSDYFLGRIDPSLQNITNSNFLKINTKPVSIFSGFPWSARLAFQPSGPGYVVYVDTANIKRRKITAEGTFGGAPATAFKSPKNNTFLVFPGLAVANGPAGIRGLMIAVENAFSVTGKAIVWAQVLDPNGVAIGAPQKIDETSATDTALRIQLFTLPTTKLNSVPYRFAGFYSLAAFQAPGQTFISSGLIQLNLTLEQQ